MNTFENYVYEPIDLCACYEPIFEAPQELIDEWKAAREAEVKEPDGFQPFMWRMSMGHCTSIMVTLGSRLPSISMTKGNLSGRW